MRPTMLLLLIFASTVSAADWSLEENPELARYFDAEVVGIEKKQSLTRFERAEDWKAQKARLRSELFDMLGIGTNRERPPLKVKKTGELTSEEFRVEKLWIQSLDGLYITASLYLPVEVDKPLPTILYVCGHARVRNDKGVSFGNKAGYQHHGAWFARNGYACLTIDTVQLGEIEGIHHGTYRHNRWWWNSRGYTPAGVEAWNCIRALDYLETRPEVDASRFGVTGRSGGGAYSWWIAALDERIKCAVPVAGITSLRNHVVDGCVEGHCDCMYMVNTFRWDYATVAALVAPRPLLISNSDKDRIFPLEGVVDIHRQVRHVYSLLGASDKLGLQITEGPHKDTQELRVHAFRWFNRWLKQDDELISVTATKFFEPPQLRVFTSLPTDERNTSIDEDFVPKAQDLSATDLPKILSDQTTWAQQATDTLRARSLSGWPAEHPEKTPAVKMSPLRLPGGINAENQVTGKRLAFHSQPHVPLHVDIITPGDAAPRETVSLLVLNDQEWSDYVAETSRNDESSKSEIDDSDISITKQIRVLAANGHTVAVFCPRGVGGSAWKGDEKKQIQIRRRFQLIGTTADTMRIWDILAATQVVSQHAKTKGVTIFGQGHAGWLGLMAAALSDHEIACRISGLSAERDRMPVLLNRARHLSPEELFALCIFRADVVMQNIDARLEEAAIRLTNDPNWQGVTKAVSRQQR